MKKGIDHSKVGEKVVRNKIHWGIEKGGGVKLTMQWH